LALRGDFADAWALHPLFWLVVPLWILLFGGIVFPQESAFQRVQSVGILVILAAFLVRWGLLHCL
jgi:TM2 domain-containing membrane protein YozV